MDNVRLFVDEWITHFADKARASKRKSLASSLVVIVATLLVPLLVSYGHDDWLAKVVPSVLSAGAAGVTAWLQFRGFNEKWRLYRTTQRQIEAELAAFDFRFGEYAGLSDEVAARRLAERVTIFQLHTNDGWATIVEQSKPTEQPTDA